MIKGKGLALLFLFGLLVTLMGMVGAAGATVLVPAEEGSSLFAGAKAHQVGDLVTIIIVENAKASQEASTQSGKSGEVNVGPGGGLLKFIPLIGASGKSDSNASGSTARGTTFTAKVTAKVIEVQENGNLLVEGQQKIVVNKEEQVITLRGVIRPEDIAADNTVLSTYMADAQIEYKGTGSFGGQRQSPGLLTRLFGLFDWLF